MSEIDALLRYLETHGEVDDDRLPEWDEFQRYADGLSAPLTVYLVGGGVMSLRGLKGATKDIDLVVATSSCSPTVCKSAASRS